jgi:hypothetical protein
MRKFKKMGRMFLDLKEEISIPHKEPIVKV